MKPKPKQKNCSHSINSSIILIILIISLMLSFYHQLFLISIEVNSSSKSKDFSKPEDSWQYFNNIVRPNADISNSGFTTVPSGASIYSVLDDIVNYPDSGGDSDYLIGDSITDTCELDMSSISLGSGKFVTSMKIYARGRRGGTPGTLPISVSFSWRIGSGTYSVSKSLQFTNFSFYWLSTDEWTGLNLTQSDINNLRVRIRIVGTTPVDKEQHLSVMYVQLTVMSNEAPTVNIISPNGGETLQNSTLITWSYNDPENQKMRFNLYHNVTGTGWTPIVSNLINKTSYLWNLSSFTQRYYNVSIKIEAFDFYNSSDEDISDGTFTIFVNHAPTVTVTAPNGGEVLENGTLITWNSNDLDGDAMSYNISYYIEGSGWFPLVSNLYNVSSYQWNLSSFTERQEKVLIKIVAFDEYNGSSEDISDDFFSIFVNHAPSVTITAPNGGEILGNNTLITWNFTDLDNDTLRFNISYYIEGLGWNSLVSNLYNVSSYQWNLSSFTKRQEKVLIKIVAFDEYNGNSEDVSDDYFTIFINHPPIINLITPNGGEIIEENIILIRWNFSDQDGDLVSFNIYYSINEFEWIPIALNIVNQSSFIWDVSNFSGEIQGLKIRIEAWDIYNGTNIDTSESYFTIKHESQIPFDYLIIIIVIIFGISSVSIPLTSVHIIRKRRKKARKERKAPLIDFIESQEGKSDIRAEVMLKNEEILKQISGKNLDEAIEILRSHNITTISENFWKKIESLNLEDDDKKAFVYYLLSLKPSERDDLLDEMIRRSKEI